MTTFTTRITSMYALPQSDTNYVVSVMWEVSGADGDHVASLSNLTQFNPTQQEGAVIPYESLTEDIVISWLPADQIETMQRGVQLQIDNMNNPPVRPTAHPLPWGRNRKQRQ